jgi:hypothetical protein
MSYKEHEGWKPHCTDGHQSTLTLVLQRLTEMRADQLVKPAVEDALDDIRFFLNFQ